jgi:hypothetical protein
MGASQSVPKPLTMAEKTRAESAVRALQETASKHDKLISDYQEERNKIEGDMEDIWIRVSCDESQLTSNHIRALEDYSIRIDELEEEIKYYQDESQSTKKAARDIKRTVDEYEKNVVLHEASRLYDSDGVLSAEGIKKNYKALAEADGKLKNTVRVREENMKKTQERAQYEKEQKASRKGPVSTSTSSSMSPHVLSSQKRVQARLNIQKNNTNPSASFLTTDITPFTSSFSIQEKIAMGEE